MFGTISTGKSQEYKQQLIEYVQIIEDLVKQNAFEIFVFKMSVIVIRCHCKMLHLYMSIAYQDL